MYFEVRNLDLDLHLCASKVFDGQQDRHLIQRRPPVDPMVKTTCLTDHVCLGGDAHVVAVMFTIVYEVDKSILKK